MGALEKYVNIKWTYENNVQMDDIEGGDILDRKRFFQILNLG